MCCPFTSMEISQAYFILAYFLSKFQTRDVPINASYDISRNNQYITICFIKEIWYQYGQYQNV